VRDVIVCGMFRSGTTLLSRSLSVHPEAVIVPDPYVYFFKGYYRHLARQEGVAVDREETTSDFFLDPRRPVLDRLMAADLGEPMPERVKAEIRDDIVRWKRDQHPGLVDRLASVDRPTFAAFYRSLVALLGALYGSPETRVLGTKVSWCEEFMPALARAFPDTRFVFVVRDLRAIVASQNSYRGKGAGTRPLLFYIRHWRKSVALIRLMESALPGMRERMTVVRYEDLVSDPEAVLRRLSAFLDLEFQPRMIDVGDFRDEGQGTPWRHNSSFAGGTGIFRDGVDRWRTVLCEAEVKAVDWLAGPELRRMGYAVSNCDRDPALLWADGVEPPFESLSEWIRPLPAAAYLEDPQARCVEYAKEMIRLELLESAAPERIPADVVRRFFIDPDIYHWLRGADGEKR